MSLRSPVCWQRNRRQRKAPGWSTREARCRSKDRRSFVMTRDAGGVSRTTLLALRAVVLIPGELRSPDVRLASRDSPSPAVEQSVPFSPGRPCGSSDPRGGIAAAQSHSFLPVRSSTPGGTERGGPVREPRLPKHRSERSERGAHGSRGTGAGRGFLPSSNAVVSTEAPDEFSSSIRHDVLLRAGADGDVPTFESTKHHEFSPARPKSSSCR